MPNFYSIIPTNLRYDKRLKVTEKIVVSEITVLTNLYGYCYAGNKYFANLYNCDVRTITRWVVNRVDELELKEEKSNVAKVLKGGFNLWM